MYIGYFEMNQVLAHKMAHFFYSDVGKCSQKLACVGKFGIRRGGGRCKVRYFNSWRRVALCRRVTW